VRDPALPSELFDDVRRALRAQQRSPRTEDVYLYWIRRYVRFHGKRHPRELERDAVARVLAHLAPEQRVAASKPSQARAALLFRYEHVLRLDAAAPPRVEGARKPRRPPVVLARRQIAQLLAELHGTPRLIAALLYGSGLRLLEACRLRIKDVDFDRRELIVRDAHGHKARRTILPALLVEPLLAQRTRARTSFELDLASGTAVVDVPDAVARRFPNAQRDPGWQWLFPATRMRARAASGVARRHHVHVSAIQRTLAAAGRTIEAPTRAVWRSLRHSFGAHLQERAHDGALVARLLGDDSPSAPTLRPSILDDEPLDVRSPLDDLTEL
jgi:integron integrase